METEKQKDLSEGGSTITIVDTSIDESYTFDYNEK